MRLIKGFIPNSFKMRYRIRKVNKGRNVRISKNTICTFPKNIFIGDNSYINSGSQIRASKNAKIVIGKNCLISYNVHMRTDNHNYKNKNMLILEQGHTEKDIIIKNDVWIAFGAQILSGVTINEGAVVAAGAIVTKDVPAYTVVGGVPAKEISKRI